MPDAGRRPSNSELFQAAAEGNEEMLRSMLNLPIDVLRLTVADLAIDPERRVRRWKNRDKVRAFIVLQLLSRTHRHRSFLKNPDYRY